METRRLLNIILFLTLSTSAAPSFSYAYSTATHSNLTQNTLREYERLTTNMFVDSDVQSVMRGSIEEDNSTRPINHFYDPIAGVGLQRNIWRDGNPVDGIAAPVWARSILKQGKPGRREELFSSDSDFSWDRAIYEYVHGDRARAMEALGHVLHLVQDATVPAHVRNDAHPTFIPRQQDPYETFTEGLGGSIAIVSHKLVQANSIEGAMKEVATFTNNNFLSRDTEFEHYIHPAEDDLYFDANFGVHKQNGHIVVRAAQEFDRKNKVEVTRYFFDDKDGEISKAYWDVLSEKAVVYGVAVIDLFFREVEKERQTGELLAMNKSYDEVTSFVDSLATVRDAKTKFTSLAAADVYELNKEDLDGYFAAAAVYGIHVPAIARESPLKDEESRKQPANALMAFNQAKQSIIGEALPEGTPIVIQPETVKDEPTVPEEESEAVVEEEVFEEESTVIAENEEGAGETKTELPSLEPGSGGYGGGAVQNSNDDGDVAAAAAADTVAAPVVLEPEANTSLATTTVTFSGTGVEGHMLTGTIGTTIATTTVATDGTWSLGPFTLEEGTVVTSFFQTSSENEDSETVAMDVIVDVTPPNVPTLSVLECIYTLREDGECLAGTTEVHLEWDEQNDAAYFSIQVEDTEVATTSATSATVTLSDEATSNVSIVAYDAAGNSASSNEEDVAVFANPIVITEVAWGGTAASADDEWIELYNRTNHVLTLENVQLEARDGSPSIQLIGTIGVGDYWTDHAYLIERGDGSATNKGEDLAIDFDALSDSGEELLLQLAATSTFLTELDATPSTDACGGWCGGSNSGKYYSMERIDVDASGSDASNWQSNDGYPVVNEYYDARGYEYGSDRKIYGTVKQESSNGYPEFGYFCEPYTESFEDGGTYAPSVPGNISTKNCTYLAGLWSTPTNFSAAGALYKGTVGSSTSIAGHQLGSMLSTQNGDIVDSLENGDNVFVAMWKQYTGSSHAGDGVAFDDYFTGAATSTPPHNDYRVLEWIFSE